MRSMLTIKIRYIIDKGDIIEEFIKSYNSIQCWYLRIWLDTILDKRLAYDLEKSWLHHLFLVQTSQETNTKYKLE